MGEVVNINAESLMHEREDDSFKLDTFYDDGTTNIVKGFIVDRNERINATPFKHLQEGVAQKIKAATICAIDRGKLVVQDVYANNYWIDENGDLIYSIDEGIGFDLFAFIADYNVSVDGEVIKQGELYISSEDFSLNSLGHLLVTATDEEKFFIQELTGMLCYTE